MTDPLALDPVLAPRERSGRAFNDEELSHDERYRAFEDHVTSGGKGEATDWMPDEYRTQVLRFVEMHANSEIMGVLPEREWIMRAPNLRRKLALTAKVQDEVGHAQLLYRVAEDLGKRGYRFAIEHFGVGRDSTRVLADMPMHFLKIDGSLMQSLSTDQGLRERVRGFIGTASKRGILTIAERVEDANTMAVLFQLGAAYMQGHYVHEPEVVLAEAR